MMNSKPIKQIRSNPSAGTTANLLKRRMPHIDYAPLMAAIKKNLSHSPIWSPAVGENGMRLYKRPAKNASFEVKITLTENGALRFYKSAVSGKSGSYSIIDFNPQGFLSWRTMNSDKMMHKGTVRSSSGAVIKLVDVAVDDAGELSLKLHKDFLKDENFAKNSLLCILMHISIKANNVKLEGGGQLASGLYKNKQASFAVLNPLSDLVNDFTKRA
jgi:hypothetical protein